VRPRPCWSTVWRPHHHIHLHSPSRPRRLRRKHPSAPLESIVRGSRDFAKCLDGARTPLPEINKLSAGTAAGNLQHPLRGDVSPLQPMRSIVLLPLPFHHSPGTHRERPAAARRRSARLSREHRICCGSQLNRAPVNTSSSKLKPADSIIGLTLARKAWPASSGGN
jgi:hypothetical protein